MSGYQPDATNRHPVGYGGTLVNNPDFIAQRYGVMVTGISGWDDALEVRDVREPRIAQDGEYADNLFLSGRSIVIEGIVAGTSWSDLQTRKRALAIVFAPHVTEKTLKMPLPSWTYAAYNLATDNASWEQCAARVVAPIAFGEVRGFTQTFQVGLRASDPRVYSGVATTTAGTRSGTVVTAAVSNSGGVEVPATITVTGPITTGNVTLVGDVTNARSPELVISGALPTIASTESLLIDLQERTITLSAGASLAAVRLVDPDIVALWKQDEAAGVVADNAQGTATYDGAWAGGPTLNQTGAYSGSTAVTYDGVNDSLAVAYSAALHPAAWTMEIRTKNIAKTTTAGKALIDCSNANRGWRLVSRAFTNRGTWYGWDLEYGNATTMTGLAGPSGRDEAQIVSHNNDYWVTGYVSWDGSQFTIGTVYVLGSDPVGGLRTRFVTYTPTGYAAPTAGSYYWMRNAAGSAFLSGSVDDIALWKRALSIDEMIALGSATTGTSNGYVYLQEKSRWGLLQPGASTYTFTNAGVAAGSALSVAYRSARV